MKQAVCALVSVIDRRQNGKVGNILAAYRYAPIQTGVIISDAASGHETESCLIFEERGDEQNLLVLFAALQAPLSLKHEYCRIASL